MTGGDAPDGATFSFSVALTDANGAPLTGAYVYTRSDNSTGKLVLDANGQGTLTGVASGDSVTIKAVPQGVTYSVSETGVALAGGSTEALGANWTTTTAHASYLVVPLLSSTPAATGCDTSAAVDTVLPVKVDVGTTASLQTSPSLPAGTTIVAKRIPDANTVPDPATDANSLAIADLLSWKVGPTGTLDVTAGKLWGLITNPSYIPVFSRLYLLVSYPGQQTAGTTATGTIGAMPSGVTFTNDYSLIGRLDTATTGSFCDKTVAGLAEGSSDENAFSGLTLSCDKVEGWSAGKTTGNVTVTGNATAAIDFGTITFTKAGTYVFTVTEPTQPGWTTVGSPATVTVDVTPGTTPGSLVATVESPATITNTKSYATLDTATTAILTKNVTANSSSAAKAFDFELSVGSAPKGGTVVTPLPASTTGSASYAAGETGEKTVSFGTITFTAPGKYFYQVQETTKSGNGWSCDDDAKTVEVDVTADAATGALSAAVITSATVENSYASSGPLDTATTAILTKEVTTNTSSVAKTFDFELSPGVATYADATTGTSPSPASLAGAATFAAGETGSKTVSFGTITFTKAGTYTYFVKETTEGGKGWTCDGGSHAVTVRVSDNGDGTLSATVDAPAAVKNSYASSGELDTAAVAILTKNVTKNVSASAKEFAFSLSASTSSAPLPANTTGSASYAAGETGEKTVSFGTITFTAPGDYAYLVRETTPSGDGWTCDDSSHSVTVHVSDNGDGTLSATVVTAATIENSYEKEPGTTPSVSLTKEVDKSSVVAGDQVTYTLTATNNGTADAQGIFVKDFVPENTTYVSCAGAGAQYGATTSGKEYVTWWIDTLAPGASETLTMTVKVNECQTGTQLFNIALAGADNPTRPDPDTNPVGTGSFSSNSVTSTVEGTDTAGTIPGTGGETSGSGVSGMLPETGDGAGSGVPGTIVLLGVVALAIGLVRRRGGRLGC